MFCFEYVFEMQYDNGHEEGTGKYNLRHGKESIGQEYESNDEETSVFSFFECDNLQKEGNVPENDVKAFERFGEVWGFS